MACWANLQFYFMISKRSQPSALLAQMKYEGWNQGLPGSGSPHFSQKGNLIFDLTGNSFFPFNCWHCLWARVSCGFLIYVNQSLLFPPRWNQPWRFSTARVKNVASVWQTGEAFQPRHEIWIRGIDICWSVPMCRARKFPLLWTTYSGLINMTDAPTVDSVTGER